MTTPSNEQSLEGLVPDGMEVVGYHVRRLTDEGAAFSQSIRFDPERASATVVVTPLVSGPEAQSALAAMRVERDEAKADAYRSSLETIALQGEINKTNERANKNWRDFRDLRLAIIGDGPMCRDCADENGRCPHSGQPCDPDEAVKEQLVSWRAAEQQVRDMVDALNWALGATGEFQPSGVGTGPFWWRAELAARVGLTFDREAHTYRLALKNQESDRG